MYIRGRRNGCTLIALTPWVNPSGQEDVPQTHAVAVGERSSRRRHKQKPGHCASGAANPARRHPLHACRIRQPEATQSILSAHLHRAPGSPPGVGQRSPKQSAIKLLDRARNHSLPGASIHRSSPGRFSTGPAQAFRLRSPVDKKQRGAPFRALPSIFSLPSRSRTRTSQ